MHLQSRLTGFGEKTTAFHSDEVTEIEQIKNFHRLRPKFLGLHVNLNSSGRVTQIEKMAFTHVAMRRDPAGRPDRFAFFKFFAHLADRTARVEALAKWRHATGAECFKFLAPAIRNGTK